MNILVSNDDGITAKGIKNLVNLARKFGKVIVVAPNSPQSAQGHSITIEHPIRIYRSDIFGPEIEAYECTGTPADCVKIAKNVVLKGEKIDLCLSGINHGSNASTNILYSGTMSAAMEGALEGIPSIGFSLDSFDPNAAFDVASLYAEKILRHYIDHGMGKACLLNVNFPNLPKEAIKGIRICRQAEGHWSENFQQGTDPSGRTYYWLTGEYLYLDKGEDSDIWALRNGFVSIVPVKYDMTAHDQLEGLQHFTNL